MVRSTRCLVSTFIVLIACTLVSAGEKGPITPAAKDKCPVCGMFVAKYPDFAAQINFKDDTYADFDGVKDMFKYYFNLAKYNPGKKLTDIDSIYVSDYYDLKWIDGYKAFLSPHLCFALIGYLKVPAKFS